MICNPLQGSHSGFFLDKCAESFSYSIAEHGAIDAEESLKLNEARLKLGVGLPLEVLQAEKALIQSRKDYVSSIIDYNKAQYKLFVSIGNKP
jgi:outer membrane protein TolC